LAVASGLATLLCVGLADAANPTGTTPSPPGKLVDIGGYRLHIWCMGKESESPAVVCLPGSGDFSFTWGLILPEVAKFTRICSYDKAYEAWSDPGPLPRTMKQEAHELHLLLHKAGVKGPYVLVGASAGGPLARVFARDYRDEVAGMVLVDSTDPDTVLGRKVNGKNVNFRLREDSKGRPVPPIQTLASSPPGSLTAEEQDRYDRYRKNQGTPQIFRPHDRLPVELQKMDIWARSHLNPLLFKAGNPFEGEEFQELYEESQREEPPLGDKPLIVLISGDKARKVGDQKKNTPPPDISAEEWDRVLEEKRLQKFAQALWSRNGKYLVVESGHEIHLYQPAWVIEAIRQVVEAVRKQARSNQP
jgi:pimeloyl-ACP methyl ester carboxylesterase